MGDEAEGVIDCSVAVAWAYSWLKPEPQLVSIPAKPSQAAHQPAWTEPADTG